MTEMASLALGEKKRKVFHVFLKPTHYIFFSPKKEQKFHLTQFPFNGKEGCRVERTQAMVSQGPGFELDSLFHYNRQLRKTRASMVSLSSLMCKTGRSITIT